MPNNDFLNLMTENIDELDCCLKANLERREGLNNKSTFNSETKLLFVGTAVPPKLRYFYSNDGNSIYKWIDDVRKTHLQTLKTRIKLTNNDLKKQACIDEIINTLYKEKIAFLDVANTFITVKDSSKDGDIKKFYLNKADFQYINNGNLKIVALTRNAKTVLEEYFGLTHILFVPFFEHTGPIREPIVKALEETK